MDAVAGSTIISMKYFAIFEVYLVESSFQICSGIAIN